MKAKEARNGTSTPRFFISNKEDRKGLFFRSAASESYLDPDLAKIHVEKKGDKVEYVQYFTDLSGYITDVKVRKTFREMPKKGKVRGYDIMVYMDSDGTNIIIQFAYDTSYGRKFAERFRSIDLKNEITIKPYNFIAKDDGKQKTGLNIFKGDDSTKKDMMLKPYYNSDNMPSFESVERGETVYDIKAHNNWLYDKFIEDVYYEFQHYEEEEKEEKEYDQRYDPGNRSSEKRSDGKIDDRHDDRRDDRGRDDDRRESRSDDRRETRSDDRRDERGREERRDDRREERRDERSDDRREERRDDRRDERSDDRRRDESRDDREEKETVRPEREKRVREPDPEDDRPRSSERSDDRRDERGNNDPNAGMNSRRYNDEDVPF